MSDNEGKVKLIQAGMFEEVIEAIRTNEVDVGFVSAMIYITRRLAQEVELSQTETAAIIEVPRGGTMPAKVVREMMMGVEYDVANIGANHDPEKQLLSNNFPIVDHYIIPDGIMATGNTIRRIVTAILEKCRQQGVTPRFSLLHPIISEIGLESENSILTWLREQGVEADIYYTHLEPDGAWVKFGSNPPVLVVGDVELGEDGQLLRAEIGDYGDMLQQAAEDKLLPEEYWI